MTRILNEKWLTKVDFSKGVIELTEWEEKIYQQGRADAIDECIEIIVDNCDSDCILDEKDCICCMVERMEQLKEQNNGELDKR